MGGLPPAVLVLIVAVLSAFAGALLTWLIIYVTGKEQDDAGKAISRDTETRREDLLRVVQTRSGPAVFVRGNRVERLEEIEDRETGEETLTAIKTVLVFAEAWIPSLREEKEKTTPPTRARGHHPGVATSASPPTPPRGRGTAERTSSLPSAQPLRLVEQINLLIQRRLQERPDLAKRGIRLTHDVQGHILIYVGQQRYRSADEIPDEDVCGFIKDTIQIWESE
jgi:hypothetical protein